MASNSEAFLILLSLSQIFFLLTNARTPLAPTRGRASPINITDILVKAKGSQFTTFIRLLNQTQVANQINIHLKSSTEGLTVLAPTNKAFLNLPAGTLNSLTNNQLVQLVLNHVLPKYYSLPDFETVSNPVRTQATGKDGSLFELYFSDKASKIYVTSGAVVTRINKVLRQKFPLGVYPLDKVLLPLEFTKVNHTPTAAPPSRNTSTFL